MEVFSDIQGLRQYLKSFHDQRKSIGFIPTMGALHQGHLELIKASSKANDITICSIFVNPAQFNNPNDLKKYPREISKDITKLEEIYCDALFVPASEMMYKEGDALNFDFGYLEEIMEGKYRPGHFKGVALIVAKLFNIVNPDKAYFGTKDIQQLTIIRRLVHELFFDIEIIPIETVRASDGLALSSRNKLLTTEERVQAVDLVKVLKEAKHKLYSGESISSVKEYVKEFFKKESVIQLEYFEIVDSEFLNDTNHFKDGKRVSLCIAGQLGKVRLIDNLSLN